jgi:hypothetical protein
VTRRLPVQGSDSNEALTGDLNDDYDDNSDDDGQGQGESTPMGVLHPNIPSMSACSDGYYHESVFFIFQFVPLLI